MRKKVSKAIVKNRFFFFKNYKSRKKMSQNGQNGYISFRCETVHIDQYVFLENEVYDINQNVSLTKDDTIKKKITNTPFSLRKQNERHKTNQQVSLSKDVTISHKKKKNERHNMNQQVSLTDFVFFFLR
ncbi:hypothetical protein EGW08_009369 [Elysia chlorotica]|uniref:Uncharacterized protein n=1 Tax=Elysia chlorotica TaxID=188477 RepID=A0A433TMP1_ELYCH|nr:hypothetical protein EGW08_009369 [Elysia chlorotica]